MYKVLNFSNRRRISHIYKFYLQPLSLLGPPTVTLNNGSISTYSLLPPGINSAAVMLLTQNVSLYANHVGRWQTPVDGFLTQKSILFPIFGQSDNGIYSFYLRDWSGEELVAIQLNISIIGLCYTISLIVSSYVVLLPNLR